jgi:type VI secretion system protein ImpF
MPRIDDAISPPAVSVLDRLLVAEEGEPRSYREALVDLRRRVLRDLEWLLNARVGCDPRLLGVSGGERGGELLHFGLPDITLVDLRNDRKREELRRWIADAVARFEPRLENVRVTLKGSDERRGSTRFQVEGRLRVDPEPIEFPFEAAVQWSDRAVEIQGARS